ncbi:hypothetical protein CC80DRAFT_541562 [Byssothecium circinans]|uniref:Uncharacterized protein n=1 Tax=Byssothecium circinans TaxID=147558 RepID=A0A6A5UFF9_9PLEO|nr:hypothetical protein CC80DRAFT_541562 [Byssothecium circinans]
MPPPPIPLPLVNPRNTTSPHQQHKTSTIKPFDYTHPIHLKVLRPLTYVALEGLLEFLITAYGIWAAFYLVYICICGVAWVVRKGKKWRGGRKGGGLEEMSLVVAGKDGEDRIGNENDGVERHMAEGGRNGGGRERRQTL